MSIHGAPSPNFNIGRDIPTPPDFLERLYAAIGSTFDLDPCSPGAMLSPVRARTHFTRHDDGLAQDWLGRVYMNPPYGRATPSWTAKARREVEVGNATLVIGLIGARTDTRWWHNDVAGNAHAWILRGRLAFGDGRSVAPFASALTMWGGDDALAHAISAEFPDAQYIPAASTVGRLAPVEPSSITYAATKETCAQFR